MNEQICSHCSGDGLIEHIGESICEECEHCNGTGRVDKKPFTEIMARKWANALKYIFDLKNKLYR